MKNLILILISMILLTSGLFFLTQETDEPIRPRLAQKIDQDLHQAQNELFFPKFTSSLSKIHILIHTKNQKWKEKILESISLPFSKSPEGKYSLQIDAIENFTPEAEAILILQFNIFENTSRNKVWEGSRIYQLDKDDFSELSKIQKN